MKAALNIFEFEEHRSYLKALLDQRKKTRSSLSLRQFSQRCGFRSPATLSMIVSGQRPLTERAAHRIAEALSLKGRRRKYWLALSRLGLAKNLTEAHQVREEMLALKSEVDETSIEIRQYRVLSDWLSTVIYVMVGMKNFPESAVDLAEQIGRGVTTEQVLQALDDLESLGLIKKQGKRWIQCLAAIHTDDDTRELAVFQYHRKMSEMAQDALNLPSEQREFNGLTIQIPLNQMENVKNRLREFRKELNEYLSQFVTDADAYQLNLQLFPLTQFEKFKGKKKS